MKVGFLIVIFWLVFIVFWAVSAIGAKKNQKGSSWQQEFWVRILIALVVTVLLNIPGVRHSYLVNAASQFNPAVRWVGVALNATGIAFAIWARWHIGKNWSAYPTLKEEHELVTSGPYRFVRHPIYTGVLFAFLGSVLAIGLLWMGAFAIVCFVFAHRITREEQLMTQQFPNQYPEYKRRTKALIPFIL